MEVGILVKIDKGEVMGVNEFMEELAEVTNFTKNHIAKTIDTRIFDPYLLISFFK